MARRSRSNREISRSAEINDKIFPRRSDAPVAAARNMPEWHGSAIRDGGHYLKKTPVPFFASGAVVERRRTQV